VAPAYLGLGSNAGNRLQHLRGAVERLHQREGLRDVAASPVYETEAHTALPDETQPPFLNAVLHVAVTCDPATLLRVAHEVERAEGRVRASEERWGPRPLDVDLLAVGPLTRQTAALTLPHPRLAERRFVLRPWADLAPNFVVPPPFDESVQTLLDQCTDAASVRRTEHPLRGRDSSRSGDAAA